MELSIPYKAIPLKTTKFQFVQEQFLNALDTDDDDPNSVIDECHATQ